MHRSACLILLLAVAPPVRAAAKASVDEVVRLYENLDLENALDMANKLLKNKKLPASDRARVLIYRGLILANVDGEKAMYDAFKAALQADPTVTLPQGQAPETETTFQRAQKDLGLAATPEIPEKAAPPPEEKSPPAGPPPPPPTGSTEAAPTEGPASPPEPPAIKGTATVEGGRIRIHIDASGPDGVRAIAVNVHIREPGDPAYQTYMMKPAGKNAFEGDYPAPPGALNAELYAEGVHDDQPAGRWPEGDKTVRLELVKPKGLDAEGTSHGSIYAALAVGGALAIAAAAIIIVVVGSQQSCPSTGSEGCLRVNIK